MKNNTYDVVVVGAGPAGCSAAYDLAVEGFSVALLDRFDFPREKACGGGVTAKGVMAFRFSIAPVVRTIVKNFVAGRELTRRFVFEGNEPIGVMTVRSELDSFVLEKTRAEGAEFHRIGSIRSLHEENDEVVLTTKDSSFRCRYLVGADGANSSIRRFAKGFDGLRMGFAIEAQVHSEEAQEPNMEFDFGVAPRGYGWIFPKGDHLNVGVYTYDKKLMVSVPQLASYVKNRLGHRKLNNVIGHPIGLGGWDFVPQNKRILLVGDAAGLCEPILGEGIFYAVRSGQIAAEAIKQGLRGESATLDSYRTGIRLLTRDLHTSWKAAVMFYRDLGLGYLALTSRPARYVLMKGYAAGIPFGVIKHKFYRMPFAEPAGVESKLSGRP